MTIRAIETTATFKGKNQLVLDTPVAHGSKGKVRLIILFPDDDDIEEREWLYAASSNPAFDFLNDPEEDIYTDTDGKPFNDKG